MFPAERGLRVRYVVNRMTVEDIPRVIEVEKLAYTTPWPPSAYRKELQDNPLARYIVARDTHVLEARGAVGPADTSSRRPFPLSLLHARPLQNTAPELASIVGFAGLWLMVDEAHVTTIAVHPEYRGRGIGELMLATLIGISYDIGARVVSLEVRVSNAVAQNLYRKYGFHEEGTRRRYYSDNHEDAKIMTTSEITLPSYRASFDGLKSALQVRLARQDGELGVAQDGTGDGR